MIKLPILYIQILHFHPMMIIFQFLNPGWSLGISLLYLVIFPYFFGIIFSSNFFVKITLKWKLQISKKGVSANKPKNLGIFLLLIFPYFCTNKWWVSKFPLFFHCFSSLNFHFCNFQIKKQSEKKKISKQRKTKGRKLNWHNWFIKKWKLRRNLFVVDLYNWINLKRRREIDHLNKNEKDETMRRSEK